MVYSFRVNSSWCSRICSSTSMTSNLHFNLLSSVGDKLPTLGLLLKKPKGVWELARGLCSHGGAASCTSLFAKERERRPNDLIMIKLQDCRTFVILILYSQCCTPFLEESVSAAGCWVVWSVLFFQLPATLTSDNDKRLGCGILINLGGWYLYRMLPPFAKFATAIDYRLSYKPCKNVILF